MQCIFLPYRRLSFDKIINSTERYINSRLGQLLQISRNQKFCLSSYLPSIAFRTSLTTMPKPKNNVEELRLMRMKASKQKSQVSPSEIYLCVLGNGAVGSPRSLYMFTDHCRYLFNCGEGTQRLAHEYKMKLSKLEHIFVTHNSWENLGGLLGLTLTIQDIGVPQVTLHGPEKVEMIYAYSKQFVMTKGLAVVRSDLEDSPFVDNTMEVHCIPIRSSNPGYSRQSSSEGENCNETDHVEKKMRVVPQPNAVAYICKGHNKKGQLDLEKCIKLGVPSGPLLGKLKNGNDVTLSNGNVVHSSQVTSADQPCPVFLVVECPSESYLEFFVTEERLRACQDPTSPFCAALVVHFTPSAVLHSPKYQAWLHGFPETTCHLLLNEDCSSTNSIAVHRVQHMLNLLHPGIFTLLHEKEEMSNSAANGTATTVQAQTLFRYHLRPDRGLDRNAPVIIDAPSYVQEAIDVPGFEESLKDLQIQLQQKNNEGVQNGEHGEYPEIAFLGTGSCIPSKVRNVSGILVNISSDCSMFMDCGEGTYNQLVRLYGQLETPKILLNLSCIFISHMHADHHLGLFTLLKQRQTAFGSSEKEFSPVTIIAPKCIGSWLQRYNDNFESISSCYRFIDSCELQANNQSESDVELPEHNFIVGANAKVSTVLVQHCPNAYGIVLESENNWKIVYSGDTIPCQSLVDAGKDCTLLIHEATMEDDLDDEAALKMHSTTSQAIKIAEKMNAKYTLLTHFSQRYAKVPLVSESFHSRVGCAFDNMRVRMCDLPILSLFIPTLQILFADNVEKLLDKGTKRKEKQKLLNASNESINAINT